MEETVPCQRRVRVARVRLAPLLKVKHVPEQMLDVLAIPVIFTLMFTYLFGGALSGSTGAYLQFLLPGTLVMTVLLLTMYTAVGLNADITGGVSDRFGSLPIWQPAPIVVCCWRVGAI